MELLNYLGYGGALLIGIVLGLIGGGGSILTVPVLVYLLSVNPVIATAYSLFVVGVSALVGAVQNMRQNLVDFRTAAVFAAPALVAVYLTRKYLLPAIPDVLFSLDSLIFTKEIGIMLFFSLIMILAALWMIWDKREIASASDAVAFNYPLILAEGVAVGVLTGIVGAGGGFLIIPALVLLARLPMKKAVATSLLIIAIKSLIGFTGDVQNYDLDWPFLLVFTGLSVIGIFLGIYFGKFIDGRKLKKAFAWLVLLMAFYIIWRETG